MNFIQSHCVRMKAIFKNRLIFIVSSGVLLLWSSLFFSYQKSPNAFNDITKPIATGGFPFKVFYYPVPPMGSDWPPSASWYPFFLNLVIWLGVGLLISILVQKKLNNNKLLTALSILAVTVSIFGLLYIMFLFD